MERNLSAFIANVKRWKGKSAKNYELAVDLLLNSLEVSMFHKTEWSYSSHNIITRIPDLVGQVWELGYGVPLEKMECILAPSNFDGSHMGNGYGPELMLAKSDCGYCLIDVKEPTK